MDLNNIAIIRLLPEHSDLRVVPEELQNLELIAHKTDYLDILNIAIKSPGWKGGQVRSIPFSDYFSHMQSIASGILYGFNLGINSEGIRDIAEKLTKGELIPDSFYNPKK